MSATQGRAFTLLKFPEPLALARPAAKDKRFARMYAQIDWLVVHMPHGLALMANIIDNLAAEKGWIAAPEQRRPVSTPPPVEEPLQRLRRLSPKLATVIDGMIDDMLREWEGPTLKGGA